MKMRVISVLLAAVFVAALTGCSFGGDAPSEDAITLTVTDHAGRSVEIPQPVTRIVSGYYISTSVCMALGLTDRLAGIEARADTRPIYSLAAPELLELPNVGTARDFNLEACLELEPELVILPMRLREVADTLDGMGVPVILVNPESVDAMIGMVYLIGSATGMNEPETRLGDLAFWFDQSLAEISDIADSVAAPPRVYITGTGSWLTTSPADMFQSELITLAGGENVAGHIDSDSRVEVSYEELLVMNPEVIIVPSEADFDVDDILSDPQLSELDAVLSGRVYKMPSDFEAWDSPIPASMLGAKWLLAVLHGREGLEDDLQRDAEDFYEQFYGVDG